MKIFEKIEYTDGGPNDKPTTIGYIKARNLDVARKILNVTHSFIQVREITREEYSRRKRIARKAFLMFNL